MYIKRRMTLKKKGFVRQKKMVNKAYRGRITNVMMIGDINHLIHNM